MTPSEPREPSKKVRDRPEKEKDLSTKRDSESRLTLRLLDKFSSKRNSQVSLNRLESRERTT